MANSLSVTTAVPNQSAFRRSLTPQALEVEPFKAALKPSKWSQAVIDPPRNMRPAPELDQVRRPLETTESRLATNQTKDSIAQAKPKDPEVVASDVTPKQATEKVSTDKVSTEKEELESPDDDKKPSQPDSTLFLVVSTTPQVLEVSVSEVSSQGPALVMQIESGLEGLLPSTSKSAEPTNGTNPLVVEEMPTAIFEKVLGDGELGKLTEKAPVEPLPTDLVPDANMKKAAVEFAKALEAYGVESVEVVVKPELAAQVVTEPTLAKTAPQESLPEDVFKLEIMDDKGHVDLPVTKEGDRNNDGFQGQQASEEGVETQTAKVDSSSNFSAGFEAVKAMDYNEAQISKSIVKTPIAPAAILDQIKDAMQKNPLQSGEKTEMIIKLRPEELGKVELKIEVLKDTIVAKFDVASQMVKETIESSLADLKNSLKDKGFSDMTFDVNVSKERTFEQRHQGGRNRAKHGVKESLEAIQINQREAQYQKSLSTLLGHSQFERMG